MNYDDEDMPDDFYEEGEDGFYDEEDDFYDDEDSFETGLDGLEEDEFYDDEDEFIEEIEYMDDEDDFDDYADESEFDEYKSSSIGKIDSNDRTLTFVVQNTTQNPLRATLFAANQGASLVQPDGLTVNVSESSHSIVRNEIFSGAFVIKGVKMSVTQQSQFDQVINITDRNATGTNSSRVWQPRTSTSPQNLNSLLIDASTQEFEVRVSTDLNFIVLPETSVVFTFNVLARVNMGNLLKGKNVAEISRTPRITGLPQLDLLQRKKRRPRKRIRRRTNKVSCTPYTRCT